LNYFVALLFYFLSLEDSILTTWPVKGSTCVRWTVFLMQMSRLISLLQGIKKQKLKLKEESDKLAPIFLI